MIFDLPFFRGLTPLIRLELLPRTSTFETFRVESCPAVGFAAYTRTKNADELDVVASPGLDQDPARSDLRKRATNQRSRLRLHTQENKE